MICELIIFQFLTLLFSSGQEKNFNKYPASEVDFAGGMYDFDSLINALWELCILQKQETDVGSP